MKSSPGAFSNLQESVSKAAMSLWEKLGERNPNSDPDGSTNDNSGNSETIQQIEAKIKICKKSRDWLYDVKVLFID